MERTYNINQWTSPCYAYLNAGDINFEIMVMSDQELIFSAVAEYIERHPALSDITVIIDNAD